jgi:hypothetical protein
MDHLPKPNIQTRQTTISAEIRRVEPDYQVKTEHVPVFKFSNGRQSKVWWRSTGAYVEVIP